MDIEIIKNWLEARTYISIEEIRKSLGKEAMDTFLSSHDEIGFRFCQHCNYYIRVENYDSMNAMCNICKDDFLSDDDVDD